jgi:hypothetical protein
MQGPNISPRNQASGGNEINKEEGQPTPPAQESSGNLLGRTIKNVPPSPAETTNYLDENRLLKGLPGDQPISSFYREWFVNQAMLLEQIDLNKVDRATQKQLELILLHGYSKAATVDEDTSRTLGIQASPFLPQDHRYHRSTPNELLEKARTAYADALGINDWELMLIDSPTIREVFARELPNSALDLNLDIHSKDSFEVLIDDLLEHARRGKFPKDRILIDFSRLLASKSTEPKDIQQDIVSEFEDALLKKVKIFLRKNPNIKSQVIADKLLGMLHLVAYTKYKDQHILLLPPFLTSPRVYTEDNSFLGRPSVVGRYEILHKLIDVAMRRTGFHIGPDHAKEAWLKLQDAKVILQNLNLPQAVLATRGSKIPTVCSDFQEFMKGKIVGQFRQLSHDEQNAAPYLKILPEATWSLLNGLAEYGKNGRIDQIFKDKGIIDLLQMSYFRMMNAMHEAIFRKDDQIGFNNQIELIHQEIQSILTVVQPYNDQTLAEAVVEKLAQGDDPVIPRNLDKPQVHLKASAMHGISSIIGSVEAQKGTNKLNVAVLKDSYFESSDVLKEAKTHQLYVLDGDNFNQKGIDEAFENPPSQYIDLFVCEFHHNISPDRQIYQLEKIAEQVKDMVFNGLVADKFTVAIDTTLSLENSQDIRTFLADPVIKTLIEEGKLNVVLVRSAQKFDMLGMDNYYGGITTTINNHQSFDSFNARMNDSEDQLRGLSYQGLAHLQRTGGSNLDAYRQGIMENTRKLYQQLPQEAIYHQGTKNLMQISQIDDENPVFLDIKFPGYAKTAVAFGKGLKDFARKERLPYTSRASFGFMTTNYVAIRGTKFRLNPGLDSDKTLSRYAAFFHAVQQTIQEVMKKEGSIDAEQLDEILADRIQNLVVS